MKNQRSITEALAFIDLDFLLDEGLPWATQASDKQHNFNSEPVEEFEINDVRDRLS